MSQEGRIKALIDSVRGQINLLKSNKLDKSSVSTQGATLIGATTPSAARAAIGASSAPTLLPAGTTSIPLDTPVGFVGYRK